MPLSFIGLPEPVPLPGGELGRVGPRRHNASDRAFYAGSFDPVTNGHIDVVRQCCAGPRRQARACGRRASGTRRGRCVPGRRIARPCWRRPAGRWPRKAGLPARIRRPSTIWSMTTAAKKLPVPRVLIRGLRDGSDFDYEMQMAGMNGAMAPDVQTVFLPASPASRPITATAGAALWNRRHGRRHVGLPWPAPVAARLKKKKVRRQARPICAISIEELTAIGRQLITTVFSTALAAGTCIQRLAPVCARRSRAAHAQSKLPTFRTPDPREGGQTFKANSRHHQGRDRRQGFTARISHPSTPLASGSSSATATTTTCRSTASLTASWPRPGTARTSTAPAARNISATCRPEFSNVPMIKRSQSICCGYMAYAYRSDPAPDANSQFFIRTCRRRLPSWTNSGKYTAWSA